MEIKDKPDFSTEKHGADFMQVVVSHSISLMYFAYLNINFYCPFYFIISKFL